MGTFQRTALITGGATGIGLASAQAFSKAGYNIVLTDLEQKVVQDAANTIEGPTLAIKLDVCDQTSIYVAFKEGERVSVKLMFCMLMLVYQA